ADRPGSVAALIGLLCVPAAAQAHSFGRIYTLPVPPRPGAAVLQQRLGQHASVLFVLAMLASRSYGGPARDAALVGAVLARPARRPIAAAANKC
ncbi:MAG: hypothetical protein AB1434_10685, partial [Pseudomonadota bacterium]